MNEIPKIIAGTALAAGSIIGAAEVANAQDAPVFTPGHGDVVEVDPTTGNTTYTEVSVVDSAPPVVGPENIASGATTDESADTTKQETPVAVGNEMEVKVSAPGSGDPMAFETTVPSTSTTAAETTLIADKEKPASSESKDTDNAAAQIAVGSIAATGIALASRRLYKARGH